MLNFQFKQKSNSSLNHLGVIEFYNKKKIHTPLCWFGLSIIESKSFQLEVFRLAGIEAFLSNAYDLYFLDNKGIRKALIEELKLLDLRHQMDSGGFQLMRSMNKSKATVSLTAEMVLEKQLEVGCDCGVQLDFPFGTNLSRFQKIKRLNKTIDNLYVTIKKLDHLDVNFSILPVIHTVSDDLYLLEYGLSKIEEILGDIPKVIGIGSLVPLVRTIKGSKKNGVESFIYSLICLRKMLPDSFIHAFGIGGTMAYLAILCGIDSYDSNGWIQKTAYGVIQLPGISDRFLKRESHNRPYLIENRKLRHNRKPINEIDLFMKCPCTACLPYYKEKWTKKDWKIKKETFSGRNENAKFLRATHNVSLYQNEIFEMRKAIDKNIILNFVKGRLKSSIYYNYIKFIENLKEKDLEKLDNFKQLLIDN